jgi:ADP-ribose pyrophosphatase YjhB (NUDIX family)
MPRPVQARDARADAMLARMPNVPRQVAAAMAAHLRREEFTCRGVAAAVESFYGQLVAAGRSPLQARLEDFEAVSSSRTRFYALMYGLKTFAPDVPLAAAAPLRRRFDAALNAKYNKKEKRPRKSTRVALLPTEWPPQWQAALPLLDRRIRIGGKTLRRLTARTRNSIIQAVGMGAAALAWARERGVELPPVFDRDFVDATARYLLIERSVRPCTAADYLERIWMLALRGGLVDEEGELALSEAISELREEAEAETPAKVEKVQEFEKKFHLGDVLVRAHRTCLMAQALPGHSAERARLHLKALVLALLVNGVDRQGDLSSLRIGREIVRTPEGWPSAFRQGKTGRNKDNGPLWPPVSAIIDAHVLGDRPKWMLEERLQDLEGMNLLSLGPQPFDTYRPSVLLREEFEISAHLVRTLVTDFLRRHRPNAAWAVKQLLGHTSRTMQATYQTDFREVAAVEAGQATILQIASAAEAAAHRPRRQRRPAAARAGSAGGF